jgi:hypothetical protein
MLSLVFIAVVTILAVFTIFARTYAGKSKKTERWEKGEIIKQLLALSERENSSSAVAARPILPRPNQAGANIEETIRQRAYELYQERGGVNGSPTDDWLQAKQEVLRRKARAGHGSS